MSDSVLPHRWQPTRLPCPWDFPGKNTGVGFHFLLQCMKVKSEREVTQTCPTLRHPLDCSIPGSSAHGIFHARVLEWVAIAISAHPSYITAILCPVKLLDPTHIVSKMHVFTKKSKLKEVHGGTNQKLFLNTQIFLSRTRDKLLCLHIMECAGLGLVIQPCPTLCSPMDCSPPGSRGDSSVKNTGVGCHVLLQGIFLIQNRMQVSCIAGRFFKTI